jgi:hypothetical protein
MPLVAEPGKPATLADIIAHVADAFSEMADATDIMVGKKYLKNFGVGGEPRVLFVPETDGGFGTPIEMGEPASFTHGCLVLVRAAPGDDDFQRFIHATDLADRVAALLVVAATGRIEGGKYGDGSPIDTNEYGVDIAFTFTYKRAVRHDVKRWELAPAVTDPNDPNAASKPGIPSGEEGVVNTFGITVTPADA